MHQNHNSLPSPHETHARPLRPFGPGVRRRPGKDALLADEPPRILSVAIVLIAVMLSILTAVCYSFEYYETMPITLSRGGEPQDGYAVGYLPASVDVEVGQKVHLHFGSMPANHAAGEATVAEVTGPNQEGLYIVRVALPEGARGPGSVGVPGPQNSGGQMTCLLVTKKVRIFTKLFSVFRNITRGS